MRCEILQKVEWTMNKEISDIGIYGGFCSSVFHDSVCRRVDS